MYAYQNPEKLGIKDAWVQWVFHLRQRNKRQVIELVEGWDATRIAIAGVIPWLSSCMIGIIWTAVGGDLQTTFTVASFILTSSSKYLNTTERIKLTMELVVLALLPIVSSIE